MKVTVPVGVVVGDVTVAVKVTDFPNVEGFGDDVKVVTLAAWFTTWLRAAELVADCVSPL